MEKKKEMEMLLFSHNIIAYIENPKQSTDKLCS